MWSRVVEFMLGCWLAVSPFIFRHPEAADSLWWTDWISAGLVSGFSLLSFWWPARRAHLATAVVACALVAIGRFSSTGELAPALQNQIVVGLLLLMFALIPSHASQPPSAWYAKAGPG